MNEELKVTDKQLRDIKLWLAYSDFEGERECADHTIIAIGELQSLRKIDIAHTLKYAEESGAACEEMKYSIEGVIKEVEILLRPDGDQSDFVRGFDAGMRKVIKRIEKHLFKYLDSEE